MSENSYESLRRLLSDSKIQELQKKIKVQDNSKVINWEKEATFAVEIKESNWTPDLIVAIDGDYSKQIINNGFPGAEVGYITVSTVVILMEKLRALENSRFVDPQLYREVEQPTSIDSLMVGSNVVLNGESSAKASMRKLLYEKLEEERIFSYSENLLETYEEMLKIRWRNKSTLPKCPHDNCETRLEKKIGQYNCVGCGGNIYSTDNLRLHELMQPSGTNGEMYGQIQETIKKLQLIHLLRSFEQNKDWFNLLGHIAFFIEGSLAVFSAPSWLAKSFRSELERINKKVREQCGLDLLIVGVERTGNFVKHFSDIDVKKDGTKDNFPNQAAYLLTNDYIKNNIVLNDDPNYVYLQDTSFGRKFFYKTKSGYKVVPSIATFNNYQSNPKTAYPAQFPRLSDCLTLLDKLVSAKYNNSVLPLATAHAEAAIPLNLGNAIFENMAREIREKK